MADITIRASDVRWKTLRADCESLSWRDGLSKDDRKAFLAVAYGIKASLETSKPGIVSVTKPAEKWHGFARLCGNHVEKLSGASCAILALVTAALSRGEFAGTAPAPKTVDAETMKLVRAES